MSDSLPKNIEQIREELIELDLDCVDMESLLESYKRQLETYYNTMSADDLVVEYVDLLEYSEEEEAILRLRFLDD